MSTKYIASNWRLPNQENSSKNDNYGLTFNGSNEYIDSNFIIPAITEYSFSVWFKTASTPSGSSFILGDGNSAGQTKSGRAGIGFYNDFFLAGMGDNSNYWYDLSSYNISSVYDNNWHHLVLTINLYTQKLYVDGSLVQTYNTSSGGGGGSSSVPAGTIGARNYVIGRYGDATGTEFDGDIDEVAIWNKVLSADDIITIYNSTNDNPGKCANLFTGGLGSGLIYWNRMGD